MITEFEVDRATWLHGEGATRSLLIREDGKKCCLGFMCLAAGVPVASMWCRSAPTDLVLSKDRALLPELFVSHSYKVAVLMELNDSITLQDNVREFELIKGFKSLGIKVTFTGEY